MEFLKAIINEPVFITFIVLFIGTRLSKFDFKGISPGSSAIFLTGFIFGIYGLKSSEHITAFGLMVFMYAIGIHSGPSFFNSFGKKGIPYFIIAISVSASTILSSILTAKIFGFSSEIVLGLFTGSLNSSSSVAILYDNGWSGALLPSYGIVYPLGLLSIVLFVQIAPALLKKNIIKEACLAGYTKKEEKHFIIRRKFMVEKSELIGKKVFELGFDEKHGVHIARLYRGDISMTIIDNIRLLEGDIILALGEENSLEKAGSFIGREVFDDLSVDPLVESRQIIINNPQVHNATIEGLAILTKYHTIISKIWRNGIELFVGGNFSFEKGDTIMALGNPKNLDRLEAFVGTKKALSGEFDLSSISFAMAMAFILSKMKLIVPSIGQLTLGISGSALFIGMIFGYLSYLGFLKRNMSHSAEVILKDLGLGLFLAGIGTKSGLGMIDMNFILIVKIIFSSLIILISSMSFVFFVCYKILKMNFIKSLACVCGGFNNTPAITTLTSMIKSDEPISFFASCYPLSLFAIILSGQLLAIIITLI